MNHFFHKFALHVSRLLGSMWTFIAAVLLIVIGGLYLGFTEKWTVESIVVIITFLMVFFLQHSQNADEKATHLKLDELIRAVEGARNEVIAVEEKPEVEVHELKEAGEQALEQEVEKLEEDVEEIREEVSELETQNSSGRKT